MEEQLTETQQQQYTALVAEARKRMRKISVSVMGITFAGCVMSNAVNVLFVNNDYFVMLMAAVTLILSLRYGKQRVDAERIEMLARAQAILDNK